MNIYKSSDVLTEPWWVTVAGCLAFAALFAGALFAA
jgi:hypothetical protein